MISTSFYETYNLGTIIDSNLGFLSCFNRCITWSDSVDISNIR